ncbi:hypothetical protein DYB26_014271 [Aphanomyces astaci]|uniref:HTH CENPB-type domain-containing protein n=1 Tax=Aphanomyces astaci TaxID=112090 RepID=A0A3R7CW09_APHAT|nr:hypothetical protein DYB26_014271 [Aphanomyces astaci]
MKAQTGSITIKKRGVKPFMPPDMEDDLVSWIEAMQRSGWPVERYEVILKASHIMSYHVGVACSLGRGWFARFESRHHDLSARVAQKLSHARNCVTKEGIVKYFYDLVKGCLGFKCTAGDAYNVDETSFKTKGGSQKVIAIRGSKNVWRGEQSDSYHLTIVAAVAADGTPVPPAIILPGKSCARGVLDDCPVPGALVSAAPKGFMNSDLFDSWLESFGEWKLRERAARDALLVLDNCSSNLSENSLSICEAYGIYLARLPPNATHLLQPLDVALFRTFKRTIARAVTQRLQSLNVTTLPRQAAIHIAGEAFNAVFPAVNGVQEQNKSVVNGFSTCVIWPLSLPKMLRRLSMAKANSVSDDRGNAPWLKTKTYARDEVLTLPPKMKGRKRVQTELEWHTRDQLHASAAKPTKRKK